MARARNRAAGTALERVADDGRPARLLQSRIEARLAHRNAAPETPFALAMSIGTVRVPVGEQRGIEPLLAAADASLYCLTHDRCGAGAAIRAVPA